MGKSKGGQTVNTGPDAGTQAHIDQLWGAANGAATTPLPGVDPLSSQAAGYFGNTAAAGNVGAQAMTGDPTSFARFMNPYQQNVVDSYLQNQAHSTGVAMNGVNSDATMSGAFGGSRADVARGVAGANIARDTGSQIAGLEANGFNTAMGNAQTAANLGLTAAGQLGGMGDYNRQVALQNNPQLRQYQAYLQAMNATPQGTRQTQVNTPGHNGFTGALGGAATGADIGSNFGPWGTGIGAGIGGLMGMFG